MGIPLEVDIELCDPSWAVKEDYDKLNWVEPIIQEPVKEKDLAYSIDWS